jgi:hypothetical protein
VVIDLIECLHLEAEEVLWRVSFPGCMFSFSSWDMTEGVQPSCYWCPCAECKSAGSNGFKTAQLQVSSCSLTLMSSRRAKIQLNKIKEKTGKLGKLEWQCKHCHKVMAKVHQGPQNHLQTCPSRPQLQSAQADSDSSDIEVQIIILMLQIQKI